MTRSLGHIAVLVTFQFLTRYCAAASVGEALIATSVDWYLVWLDKGEVNGAQTCTAARANLGWISVCLPSRLRVDLQPREDGSCGVSNFKSVAGSLADELENTQAFLPLARGAPISNAACETVFSSSPTRAFTVRPASRPADKLLTEMARQSALSWLEETSWFAHSEYRSCRIHFPIARVDDPMFHVYAACDGRVVRVWEFLTKKDHMISRVPQWTYTEVKKSIPHGVQERLRNRKLWHDSVSLPQTTGHRSK